MSQTYTADQIDLEALLSAGVHFGHQTHRWNAHMKPYLYGSQEGVHIFDLVKTADHLAKAQQFAYELGKANKTLVVVGTKRQAQELVENAVKDTGVMFITTRWMGGFLTNWEQISLSIQKMLRLQAKLEKPEEKPVEQPPENQRLGPARKRGLVQTKFERVQEKKELDRLARFFRGVKTLKSTPDALFIIDVVHEKVAISEAKTIGLPVIAITDSNADPRGISHPIPGNDDAVSSLELLVKAVVDAYAAGRGTLKKEAA